MNLLKNENNCLEIKETYKTGKGVFVNKDFKQNDLVFKITGTFFPVKKEKEFDEKTISNSIRFNKSTYLNPAGSFGDFLNHSCNPNSAIKKIGTSLYIFAIKEIFTGKEVLIDYSTILAEDDFWKMKCLCGESKCRGIIEKFSLLSQETKEEYIFLGAVPQYILNTYKNNSFKFQSRVK